MYAFLTEAALLLGDSSSEDEVTGGSGLTNGIEKLAKLGCQRRSSGEHAYQQLRRLLWDAGYNKKAVQV